RPLSPISQHKIEKLANLSRTLPKPRNEFYPTKTFETLPSPDRSFRNPSDQLQAEEWLNSPYWTCRQGIQSQLGIAKQVFEQKPDFLEKAQGNLDVRANVEKTQIATAFQQWKRKALTTENLILELDNIQARSIDRETIRLAREVALELASERW